MKTLPLTPVKDFVITESDRNVVLGSGELKPCPFCGGKAISVGSKNEESGNTGYRVICTEFCGAHLHVCQKDPAQARKEAVERWNRRVS